MANSPGKKTMGAKPGKRISNPQKIRAISKQVQDLCEDLMPSGKMTVLRDLGAGTNFFTCQRCGEIKAKEDFYICTNPGVKSGVTNICRTCADRVAMPLDMDGNKKEITKESMDYALYLLDKPMLETVWETSIREANSDNGEVLNTIYGCYMKNISMQQYYTYTYRDSDGYTAGMLSLDSMLKKTESFEDAEIINQFDKNKNDVLRLLGYLPFENEKLSAQPFLYSQLVGFLDSSEEGNDDMMRIQSIISIVRGFAQASIIDDNIAKLSADTKTADRNVSTIKAYQTMKKDVMTSVVNLAKENCISLKNSKHSVKGENTWTGKVKKIKDLNLREGEVNGFDIATCKGMRQVQEISDASIMKQLALDETEWSDMVATMRLELTELRKQKDSYQEINRILLKENIDLKDYIEERGLNLKSNLVNLKNLYSPFSCIGEEEDEYDSFEDEESYVEEIDYTDEEEDSEKINEEDYEDGGNER